MDLGESVNVFAKAYPACVYGKITGNCTGEFLAQTNRAKLHHTLQYSSDNKAAMNTGGLKIVQLNMHTQPSCETYINVCSNKDLTSYIV